MITAGCTTGWVNYANERSQAALERSSQDAYNAISLTRSKAAVDSRRCGAFDQCPVVAPSLAGPAAWNSLPDYPPDPPRSFDSFHRCPKTFMFFFCRFSDMRSGL